MESLATYVKLDRHGERVGRTSSDVISKLLLH